MLTNVRLWMRAVDAPSVEEAGLMEGDAQLTVDGGENAFHLTQRKHTAQEGVAGIVAAVLITQHRHAMVYTHGQMGVGLLKDTCQLNQVGTSAEMGGFGEVAVGEDVAGA